MQIKSQGTWVDEMSLGEQNFMVDWTFPTYLINDHVHLDAAIILYSSKLCNLRQVSYHLFCHQANSYLACPRILPSLCNQDKGHQSLVELSCLIENFFFFFNDRRSDFSDVHFGLFYAFRFQGEWKHIGS